MIRAVIELLGVGIPRAGGGWLLRRASARLEPGALTLVLSADPDERRALIDALTARLVPTEGRVYVAGIPLDRESLRRVRARVGAVRLSTPILDDRTLLWNVVARPGVAIAAAAWGRSLWPPSRRAGRGALAEVGLGEAVSSPAAMLDEDGRLSLQIARALLGGPACLVVREPDREFGLPAAQRLLALLRAVARAHRLAAVATVASATLAAPGDVVARITRSSLAVYRSGEAALPLLAV